MFCTLFIFGKWHCMWWSSQLTFCEQQIHWMFMALPFVFEITTRIYLSAWHHQQCALYLGKPVCFCFVFPFEPNFSLNPKVPTLILMHSGTRTVFVCLLVMKNTYSQVRIWFWLSALIVVFCCISALIVVLVLLYWFFIPLAQICNVSVNWCKSLKVGVDVDIKNTTDL